MATIVVSSLGTFGDVFPFVAIGRELRARGHRVRMLVPRAFHPMVAAEGFEVRHCGFEISPTEFAADPEVDWLKWGGLQLMRRVLKKHVLPQLRDGYDALAAACEDADLLVSHVNQVAAPMVREVVGIAWASVSMFPMMIPTVHHRDCFPIPRLPGAPGRIAMRVLFAASRGLTGRVLWDAEFNEFRAALGLRPRRAGFFTGSLEADAVVVLVPPCYLERPPDWPEEARLSGFCSWEGPSAWRTPEELRRFLASGDPPVIVTLGSSTAGSPMTSTISSSRLSTGCISVEYSSSATRLRFLRFGALRSPRSATLHSRRFCRIAEWPSITAAMAPRRPRFSPAFRRSSRPRPWTSDGTGGGSPLWVAESLSRGVRVIV